MVRSWNAREQHSPRVAPIATMMGSHSVPASSPAPFASACSAPGDCIVRERGNIGEARRSYTSLTVTRDGFTHIMANYNVRT